MSAAIGSPVPRSVWDEVAAADPEALPTQSAAWTRAVSDVTGWRDASRLYLNGDRRIVLPMTRAPLPRMATASHRTHWGFGGLLAEGGVTSEDVQLVVDDLRSQAILRQAIRPNPLHGPLWAHAATEETLIPRRAHVLDLTGGEAAVWSRMDRQGRKSIRAAEARGITVESDGSGRLLPVFFQLQRRSQERWAAAQHEPMWFARLRYRFYDTQSKWERISSRLGSACRVLVASREGEPLAASIVLSGGQNVHHTRSASQPAAARTYAAEALVWTAVRDACAAGAHRYHMGESGDSASLARFKEKLGCTPHDYAEVRFERIPVTAADRVLRAGVKRLIGFQDVR